MKLADFERMAPRYIDQEVNPTEKAACDVFSQTSMVALREADAVQAENLLMAAAFTRAIPDLTIPIAGARDRNPNRKRGLSPFASLGVQVAALLLVCVSLVSLNGQVAPPRITLTVVAGTCRVDEYEDLVEGGRLPMGGRLEAAERSQARVQVGAADSVRVNEKSAVRFLHPRPGVRNVLALEEGEAWVRSIDSQSRFLLLLGGEESEVGLEAERAEFDVAMKPQLEALWPRGEAASASAVAVVRVLEGTVSMRGGATGSEKLVPGAAWIVEKGGALRKVADPDLEHYPALRMDPRRGFRQTWDWLSTDRLPLSREVLRYEDWKALVGFAERIRLERERAVARDGGGELREVMARGRAELLKAQAENATPAEKGMVPHLKAVLDGWASAEPTYTQLAASANARELTKVLASFEASALQQLERAAEHLRKVDTQGASLGGVVARVQAALKSYGEYAEKEMRDPSGSRRVALTAEIKKLREELARLEGLGREVEFLQQQLAPLEATIEGLRNQLSPRRKRHAELTAEQEQLNVGIAANVYTVERLAAAAGSLEAANNLLAQRTTEHASAVAAVTASRGRIAELASAIVAATKERDGKILERDVVDAEIGAVLVAIGEIRARLEDDWLIETALVKADGSSEQLSAVRARIAESQRLLASETAKLAALLATSAPLTAAVDAQQLIIDRSTAERTARTTQLEHEESKAREADAALRVAESQQAEAKRQHDLQLAAKAEREALEKRLSEVVAEREPLGKEIGELEAELGENDGKASPLRVKLDALNADRDRRPGLQQDVARAEIAFNQHAGVEREVLIASRLVVEEQAALGVELVEYESRLRSVASVLGGTLAGEEAEVATERRRWTTEALQLIEIKDFGREPDEELHQAVRALMTQASAWQESSRRRLEQAREDVATMLVTQDSRAGALSMLRAVADRHAAEVESDLAGRALRYEALRREIGGFDATSPAAGTVFALMDASSRSRGSYRVPQAAVKAEELRRELFEAQWELFYSTELPKPGAKGEGAKRSYLTLLRIDPLDHRVQSVNTEWTTKLISKIGEAPYKALVEQRRQE